MLVLGKNWKTRSSLDGKLIGKVRHKVEPIFRFATSASHQLHSSHIPQHTVLSRWTSSNRLQTGIISRRRFCRRSDSLRINLKWCPVHIGSQTFVPISWVCKKGTSVSHSGTEAEIYRLMQGYACGALPDSAPVAAVCFRLVMIFPVDSVSQNVSRGSVSPGDLELENVFEDHGLSWLIIDEMFALELETYRRCLPTKPVLSALRRYNRRKRAAATADLPPNSALFSQRLLDLTHKWSEREDNDIDIGHWRFLPPGSRSLFPFVVALSAVSRSGSIPIPRHNAPLLHTPWTFQHMSLKSFASWGHSTSSLGHTRQQLGSKSSSSSSPCGVSSHLIYLNARSFHWFLPTCLLGVLKILLMCTFVSSPFTMDSRPSQVGGSALSLSCGFWIGLQTAARGDTTSARSVWHAPP